MAERQRYEAAPLDARGRALIVGWLSAWFLAVAGLLAWSLLGGGGLAALGTAVVAAAVLPFALLHRLAGLPSAFEMDGPRLHVRRHLLPDRTFTVSGPVATGAGPLRLGGPGRWFGAGYGCRWIDWAADDEQRERIYLAVTDASRAVRIGTEEGTLLATPAAPKRLAQAARAAARQDR